ncbi:MAG: hypothetical protein KKB51_20705 [Candidatus Riflebacteria bacterium]|nr:hypothetical protein [Candidatus Riflebacteria bacterium]
MRFSHKTHDKNSVSCVTCHVDREISETATMPGLPAGWQPLRNTPIVDPAAGSVTTQKQGMDDTFARPGEKRCLECHFKTREKADCGLCHLEKPANTERARQRLKKEFKFNHKKHEKFECSRCHPGITNWENLDGHYIEGRMENCLECHKGQETPKNCVMCHNPTPRPADHTRNYEKKHGMAYRFDPNGCSMCHEDSSCLDCHSRKPRDHTLAWVKRRHGISAQTNPQKCQACHSDPYVCKRCHDNR